MRHSTATIRGIGLAMLAATAVVAAALSTAQPAHAQATERLDGVVVHGVEAAPVAELTVWLHEATGDGTEGARLDETTTDEEGRFAFTGLVHGTPYELMTVHDDAEHRSDPLVIGAGMDSSVLLTVYDSTDADDDIVVSAWMVWVDLADVAVVQQDLQVTNRGTTTYLGVEPDDAGVRRVLTIPLPADATELRFLGRFTSCCSQLRGTDYVLTSPLPPGDTVGTVRYVVDELEVLTLPVRLPVAAFTLMVPEGSRVAHDGLEPDGTIESQDSRYDVYVTAGLSPGDTLEIGIDAPRATGTTTRTLAIAAAATLAVLALLAVGWRWRQRTGRDRASLRDSSRPADDDQASARGSGGKDDGESHGAVPTLTVELLVEEIALLDIGVDRGLLPREVYEPLRAARKAELLALSRAGTGPDRVED